MKTHSKISIWVGQSFVARGAEFSIILVLQGNRSLRPPVKVLGMTVAIPTGW